MDLNKLIKPKSRTLWFEYCPGFDVQVRYMPLAERAAALEGSDRVVLKGGKLQQDGLTAALESLTAAMIVNWKLPAAVAVKLLEVEAEDLGGATEIPCTEENKLALIRNASSFGLRVNNVATVLENFRAAEVKEETENLPHT
jgi:hypothetical protein